MKHKIQSLLTIIFTCLTIISSNAAPVGTAFNYQGELLLNNQPANGVFDFAITPYDVETNGNSLNNSAFISNVTVTNGIFNLPEVIFPASMYDNGIEIWLTIHVKADGTNQYTNLTPRQRLSATPYSVFSKTAEDSIFSEFSQTCGIADELAPGNANDGDVLQFNQGAWNPMPLQSASQNFWEEVVPGKIKYKGGKVGISPIGFPINARLHVNSEVGETPFRAQIDGFTKFVVTSNGQVGVGVLNPSYKFDVRSAIGEPPLRISSGNTPRLSMNANNAMFISDTVNISGETNFNGGANFNNSTTFNANTKQFNNANGQIKYTAKVSCINAGNASIESQYNGTSQGVIGVVPDGVGQCSLNFPTDISQRYWITSLYDATVSASVSCKYAAINDSLQCDIRRGSDNSLISGHFTLIVY